VQGGMYLPLSSEEVSWTHRRERMKVDPAQRTIFLGKNAIRFSRGVDMHHDSEKATCGIRWKVEGVGKKKVQGRAGS